MNSFLTRIELHRGSPDDYSVLHTLMEQVGFSRKIRAADGIIYHLPSAEYNIVGNYTLEQVREAAQNAVNRTRDSAIVFVVLYTGWASRGLIPV